MSRAQISLVWIENVKMKEEIIQFVSTETRVPIKKLSLETRLFHDIGLDGDDARELLDKFSHQFNVDISGLELDLYFGPEAGFNPFSFLLSRLLGNKTSSKQPLTIKDLVNAAKNKPLSNCD